MFFFGGVKVHLFNWKALLFLFDGIQGRMAIENKETLWVECSPKVQETEVQSQVESYQRFKKMVFDAALLNTQHYKIGIKGKVDQSKERCSALPYTSM